MDAVLQIGTKVESAGEIDRAMRRADELARNTLRNGPRSRVEIERMLIRRGVSAEQAAECIDRLERAKLVDDALFARLWVGSRQRNRGLSRHRLRDELEARGVADEHIDNALDLVDDEDEREAARRLARKGLARNRGVAETVARRRVAAMLMRRGYRAQLVRSVLAECSAESGSDRSESVGLGFDEESQAWSGEVD